MAVENQRKQAKNIANSHTHNPHTTTTATNGASSSNNNHNNNNNSNSYNSNGGPRVSFNRDVHVKRIGKHPNDYETTNLQPPQNNSGSYHQLPTDLSEESIRKEAALVLAQAERHKSKADNPELPHTYKIRAKREQQDPKKFHSLPTRKKKNAKGVTRSVSDAAAKKPSKRPSILSIFSRKSDTQINQTERDPRFESSGGRRLVRSKSDVGEEARARKLLKDSKLQPISSRPIGTSTPLSPIIENTLKEDYFAEQQHNLERRKSDAITHREKHASALNELLARSEDQAETDGNILNSPETNKSDSIQDKIRHFESKSQENMHSSQQPVEKLPLTKGKTVNGLVKRLSMERFSPPPPLTQPAFSYIRPNEGINYAQLDMEGRGTPIRDLRSPERDHQNLNRHINARTDTRTSQLNSSPYDAGTTHIKIRSRDSFSPIRPVVTPTTIRITNSHSPSPWKQLSPRNLSDEDEGLGIETRRYFGEDDALRSKSPTEPPIIPVIREHDVYDGRDYRESPQIDELGYRRARLESRLATRRFGDPGTDAYHSAPKPTERYHDIHRENDPTQRYLSPDRDFPEKRFHKPQTSEILHKYSPERTHIDILSPQSTTSKPNEQTNGLTERRSRYTHTKYHHDGHGGGVKEVYKRETVTDAKGVPHVQESRHRERLDSYSRERGESSPIERLDYEPKSLDSQFTSTDQYRSSPENMKRYTNMNEGGQHHDHWHNEGSSLKRDKLQQRSFDKGDSGIENDFRKESFNGDISRWRKRTNADDIRICDNFLKKERRHTEQIHSPPPRKEIYIYRERSIDDGSHYDPHLDKYPTSTSTLRRKDQQSQTAQTETLKRNKKLGGFEKVKQLFTGNNQNNVKKDSDRNGSTSSSTQTPPREKDRYMVKEEEMRTRYREYRSGTSQSSDALKEPKAIDISMRRRLSTPKASPLLLKRTSSDKTAKKASPLASKPEKTSWFKSLDRRSKSKSKEKPIANGHSQSETSSMKRIKSKAAQPKNLRFFGDTDLDSNPPTVSKANTSAKSRSTLPSTLVRSQKHSQSAYNLDRIHPSHSAQQDYRPGLANRGTARHRSTSLHNLENERLNDEVDFRKRRHFSRSRELHDISESGSETEEQHKRTPIGIGNRTLSRERLDRAHRYETDNAYRRSNDRNLSKETSINGSHAADTSASSTLRRPSRLLTGPPKPARSAERRVLSPFNRNNDRYPAESSGTEGESSLHSQRSVVYLHATTVGAIPQPYQLRRRSISRDDLRSKGKSQPLQPMTRTVSRSVSMLAPWTPKHISEGYEINYSQEQNKQMATMPRGPNQAKKSDLRNRRQELLKDDQSSLRNSSTTSASKSALSNNTRRKIK